MAECTTAQNVRFLKHCILRVSKCSKKILLEFLIFLYTFFKLYSLNFKVAKCKLSICIFILSLLHMMIDEDLLIRSKYRASPKPFNRDVRNHNQISFIFGLMNKKDECLSSWLVYSVSKAHKFFYNSLKLWWWPILMSDESDDLFFGILLVKTKYFLGSYRQFSDHWIADYLRKNIIAKNS